MRQKVIATVRILSNSVQYDYYDHTLECGCIRGNKNSKSKSLECFVCEDLKKKNCEIEPVALEVKE